jgi:DNA (cytosine-5)-methyltransferase 1
MNGLDLFSGIGGNTTALREWVKTVAYCEINPYAKAVLLSRMGDGSIPTVPIWDDITTLRGDMFDIPIDIIVGGFPCQDISCAGSGAGLAGECSGLFFEIVRLAKEIKPQFLFLENVAAIRTRGLDTVVETLADIGYDCRWGAISAYDMGAPHKRERWFLLANSRSGRQCGGGEGEDEQPRGAQTVSSGADVAYANGKHQPKNYQGHDTLDEQRTALGRRELLATGAGAGNRIERGANTEGNGTHTALSAGTEVCSDVAGSTSTEGHTSGCGWWDVEPDVGRVAHGVPDRVDRLRCLGNAVVPAQAREAFRRLMAIKE